MQEWIDSIGGIAGLEMADLQAPWVMLLIRSVVLITILVVLRWITLLVVRRNTDDARTRYTWRKVTTYVVVVLGIFLIGRVWFEGFRSLATYLGLLSAGLAIALREPIVDVAGWVFILWRRPFVVGDRVEIRGTSGDVVDQRVFQFTLLEIGNWVGADQSTGRIVHIPNGDIFDHPLYNYTRSFPYIWNELAVLVTFESDWQAAKAILREVADRYGKPLTEEAERAVLRASRRYLIFYSTLSPTVYTTVEDSGVLLTIRYLCEVRRRRSTAEAIWEDILRSFGERDDIDFAYPTTRYYNNVAEGKPGTIPGGPRQP